MRIGRGLAVLGVVAVVLLGLRAPGAGAAGQGGVLIVGDSLAVLTSPYLERLLPDLPLVVNAENGYNSNQIFELFEESYEPSYSVIVFDAGTNDNPAYPEILAGNLSTVAASIGDRCMVVPTVHGYTVNGIGNEGKNRVVAELAASRPGTQTPDWARVATTRPDLMQADDLHPTPEGAALRAQLLARAVRACLGYSAGAAGETAPVSRPEIAPVGRLSDRQAELSSSLAAALARRLAFGIVARKPPLAGALTVASLGLDCHDWMPICAPPSIPGAEDRR